MYSLERRQDATSENKDSVWDGEVGWQGESYDNIAIIVSWVNGIVHVHAHKLHFLFLISIPDK